MKRSARFAYLLAGLLFSDGLNLLKPLPKVQHQTAAVICLFIAALTAYIGGLVADKAL